MNRQYAVLVAGSIAFVVSVCGPRKTEAALLAEDPSPSRAWQVVSGKHWQIVGPRGEHVAITDAREGNRGACAPGQIEVSGKMKQHELLDNLQMQACTKWIDKRLRARPRRVRERSPLEGAQGREARAAHRRGGKG